LFSGQASSPVAEATGSLARIFADIGWDTVSGGKFASSLKPSSGEQKRHYSTMSKSTKGFEMNTQHYSTSADREIPG
jgi:hypothetical protein